MNLQLTSGSTLQLFPPDDAEDVPRYTLRRRGFKGSERFITMIPEDELKVQKEEEGVIVVRVGRNTVGAIDEENDAVLAFVEEWDRCLDFVKGERKSSDDEGEARMMNPSLRRHLHEREAEFVEKAKEVEFRFLSWNLGGGPVWSTTEDLSDLFLANGRKLDLYFVAFQEIIPLNAKNFRSSNIPVDHWITKIMETLGPDEYTVLQTNKLLGLASILICRTSLAINFQDLEISSVGTGILNVYGNKGAIATSFKVQNHRFTLLDCHFAAGESEQFVFKRRKELQGIQNYIKLPTIEGKLVSEDTSVLFDVESHEVESDEDEEAILGDVSPVTSHNDDENDIRPRTEESTSNTDMNVIFIGGDMNYRIKDGHSRIQKHIIEKNYKALLEHDTLTNERDQGRILQGFDEGNIKFPPTYKYKGDYYDMERRPSYTDRIFSSTAPFVRQNSYDSSDVSLSDHRPVYADYTLTLPIINNAKRQTIVTQFLKKVDDEVNNAKRTTLTIDPLESQISTHILQPTSIQIKVTNTGACKTYWEILDSVDTIESKTGVTSIQTRIEPKKGVLPKTATQTLSISTTLPIGVQKLHKTIILRSYNSQDHFLTVEFLAKKTYFGATIDELHSTGSGIPKPIYTLINYLTGHIRKDMFDEGKLNFTHELEKKIVVWIDEDQDLDLKELEEADSVMDGSSITAVSRVLLLLLRNLDGGLVNEDLSTYLLGNYKGDETFLESLPPLRANVLIYLASFLRLCVEFGIPREVIVNKFEPLLIQVPQRRKRDVMLGRAKYDKLRRDFMEHLIG